MNHYRIGNVIMADFNTEPRGHQIRLHHAEWLPDIGAYLAFSDEFPDKQFLLIPNWDGA
jgi:hypothetical protein